MLAANETLGADKNLKKIMLVPTLIICTFLAYTIYFFLSTLLVDIASSFKVSIGTASQLVMIGSLIGLIMGLVMSAISIRLNHKALFLLGIAIFATGTLSYFIAQNFAAAMFSEFLITIGMTVITVMVYTLIGEQLPLEKRGLAVGVVVSSLMSAAVIAAAISGFIASIAGWRMVLLWFVFPLSIVCLALGSVFVPSEQPQPQLTAKPSYAQALKKIFLNKSSIACVVSVTLAEFLGVFPLYAVSFYRIAFSVSPAMGGVCFSIAAVGGIVGGVTGGRLVNRYKRKPLAVVGVVVSSVSMIMFTFIPVLWVSVVVWGINACAVAITVTGLLSLTLEQVPEFRASMMSITNSSDNAGTILAVIIGGLVLNLFHNDFHMLYVILGVLGSSIAAILLFLAREPS